MEPRSTCFTAFCTAISLVLFVSRIVVDLLLSVQYKRHNHTTYFAITLFIFIGPTVIVSLMSTKWHRNDGRKSFGTLFAAMIQLGVLHRHILVYRLCTRKYIGMDAEGLRVLEEQQTDLRLLLLYEAFLKSAPQLVFQLYLLYDTNDWTILTVVSASLSLLSLCWAVIDYDIASWHRRFKRNRTCCCYFNLCLTLHEVGKITAVLTRITAMTVMTIADDERAPLLVVANCALAMVFVILSKDDDVAPRTGDGMYWLHNIAKTAAFTFSFSDVPDSSRAVVPFVYAHGYFQNREGLVQFYKERLKYGARFYQPFTCVLLSLFVCAVVCIWLGCCLCSKLQGPNEGTLREEPQQEEAQNGGVNGGDLQMEEVHR